MTKKQRWVIAFGAVIAVSLGPAIVAKMMRPPAWSDNEPLGGTLSLRDGATPPSSPDASSSPTSGPSSPGPSADAAARAKARAKAAKAKASRSAAKKAKTLASQKTTTASGGSSKVAAASGGRIKLGTTYTGVATFYAATGAGNCSFDASSDRMIGAMNKLDYDGSRACGDFVSVKGPNGKSITIKIVDQCPECPAGAIDLSKEAFAKLAPTSAGRVKISWHLVSPSVSGPVSYVYKDGSSQFWCGVQVRNHRNPVQKLELKTKSGWKSLERADFNYFLSTDGSGCGGSIRVTDIFGNQLTDSGISIKPGAVQPGHAQFPAA